MSATRLRLTMLEYLEAIDGHQMDAYETLLARGYHPEVIVAKAEKAIRKGYAECGVSERRSWIEEPGREFLRRHGKTPAPPKPPENQAYPLADGGFVSLVRKAGVPFLRFVNGATIDKIEET